MNDKSHKTQQNDEDQAVCPICGGQLELHGVIGYNKDNQEMEADWLQCVKCGTAMPETAVELKRDEAGHRILSGVGEGQISDCAPAARKES